MRILVVKRDKIGDLLLATPMLRVLRTALPGSRIEVLASDYGAWVLAGNRDVDRVWAYRRARTSAGVSLAGALSQAALWLRLRAANFDVAIAANGEDSPRATRRALLAGAKRTIAYAASPRRGLTDALPPPAAGHERDRLIALLAPLGIAAPAEAPLPVYEPPAAWLDGAREWLAQRSLAPGGYLVLGLGARRPKKQPTRDQVVAWTTALKARHGLDTVFMWTPGRGDNPDYPGDDDVAAPVLDARLAHLHPFRGPIAPAVALVWLARTSLFPDSGLMHVAAASPGGVLGLYAETAVSPHPSQWGPLGPRADYLDAPKSVSELADELVLARLERLLGPAA